MPTHLAFRDIQPRYFPGLSAKRINQGNCFNWALIAKWEYPDTAIELCTVEGHGGHAFIKIGDRYFDSSHPTGSTNWREMLPWADPSDLYDDDMVIQDEDAFIEHWNWHGAFRVWDKQAIHQGGEIQRIRRNGTVAEHIHFVVPLTPRTL